MKKNLIFLTNLIFNFFLFFAFSELLWANNPHYSLKTFDKFIIRLKSGLNLKIKNNFRSLNIDVLFELPQSNLVIVKWKKPIEVQLAVKALQSVSEVEYVEPDYSLSLSKNNVGQNFDNSSVSNISSDRNFSTPSSSSITINKIKQAESLIPNDTYFNNQWSLHDKTSKNPNSVDIQGAWSKTRGDKEVIAVIISSGLNFDHPDLKNNLWVNEAENNGLPNVDDDGNGVVDDVHGYNSMDHNNDILDEYGLGTNAAGVLGAVTNNKLGISGVAWNLSLMPIKFSDYTGFSSVSYAIRAIDYALQMKKDRPMVIVAPWNFTSYSLLLKEAIQRAGEAGVTFFIPAGDSNKLLTIRAEYPANYDLDNLVVVGGSDEFGQRANFSNFSPTRVHLIAPGKRILTTEIGHKYAIMDGTIYSSSYAAGVATLMLSVNPNLQPFEVKKILIGTSVFNSELKPFAASMGILNAKLAIDEVSTLNSIKPFIQDSAKVCSRTWPVRNAIEQKLNRPCEKITEQELKSLKSLFINSWDWPEFDAHDFEGLSSLERLKLVADFDKSYSGTTLPQGIFKPLVALKTLTLNLGDLNSVNFDFFNDLTHLENLDFNPSYTYLPLGFFKKLINLKTLKIDIYKHNIVELDQNFFEGLENLEELEFDIEYIKSIHQNVFVNLQKLKTLKSDFFKFKTQHLLPLKNLKTLEARIDDVNHDAIFPEGLVDLSLSIFANDYHFCNHQNLKSIKILTLNYYHFSNSKFNANELNCVENVESLQILNPNQKAYEDDFFHSLKKIKYLDLRFNGLDKISQVQFRGLDMLSDLLLINNELVDIAPGTFQAPNFPETANVYIMDQNQLSDESLNILNKELRDRLF